MATVVPTILATTPEDYAKRLDRVRGFAKRIHVDVSDGVFTPTRTINLAQIYHPAELELNLHLMLKDPLTEFENVVAAEPTLVVIHFESAGDIRSIFHRLRELGIAGGLAIKQETKVEQVAELLPEVDHLLVFCGTLGFNHGKFDASVLDKIQAAKSVNSRLEVAVDGGIDERAARLAVEAGADVLNVGSFIQEASDSKAAYLNLAGIASGQ